MLQPIGGTDRIFICPELCRGNSRTFIYNSIAGIGVMFHPDYAGMQLIEEMTKAAADFWLALFWLEMAEGRPLPDKNNLVEYILLTGGKYYCLREGLWGLSKNFINVTEIDNENDHPSIYTGNAFKYWMDGQPEKQANIINFFSNAKTDIQQVYLGVRREEIHKGNWVANRYYDSFEYVPEDGFFVSGDTIASGITGCESIAYLCNYYLLKGKKIARLVINSVFASEYGVKQIINYASDKFPELKLDIFVAGALLDMEMVHQTDLSFYRDGRWQIQQVKKFRAGHPVIDRLIECLTDDWGTRNKHPRLYLQKRLAEFTQLEKEIAGGLAADWLTEEVKKIVIAELKKLKINISMLLK